LPNWLSQPRIAHCKRVADTALALAKHWKISPPKAYFSGIVHDIAKEMNEKDMAKLKIKQSSEELAIYQDFFPIWHAFIAPKVIQTLFQIKDPGILSSAKWHTTGSNNMSPLDQVIFIADFIEPGRKKDPLQSDIQNLAYDDLNLTTFCIVTISILNLIKKGVKISRYSFDCHDYYLKYARNNEEKYPFIKLIQDVFSKESQLIKQLKG